MRFDVSELKTAHECGRKWLYSSRNAYHMRPKVTNDNLWFGSLFHECLHTLYLQGDPSKVAEQAVRECNGDVTKEKVIRNMLEGYASEVLPADLERYQVLDIEHAVKFDTGVIDPTTGEPVQVCGSIDMVALERATNLLFGFEHKTASKFRPDIYIMMDEQPRVYFIELQAYADKLNEEYFKKNGKYPEPLIRVGGIYINEVKKVQRKFEYMRRLCKYSEAEVLRFKSTLNLVAHKLLNMRNGVGTDCQPSYMGCQMCDYASICAQYGYQQAPLEDILDEFVEEFEVRECDHLDEKAERRIEG